VVELIDTASIAPADPSAPTLFGHHNYLLSMDLRLDTSFADVIF